MKIRRARKMPRFHSEARTLLGLLRGYSLAAEHLTKTEQDADVELIRKALVLKFLEGRVYAQVGVQQIFEGKG